MDTKENVFGAIISLFQKHLKLLQVFSIDFLEIWSRQKQYDYNVRTYPDLPFDSNRKEIFIGKKHDKHKYTNDHRTP